MLPARDGLTVIRRKLANSYEPLRNPPLSGVGSRAREGFGNGFPPVEFRVKNVVVQSFYDLADISAIAPARSPRPVQTILLERNEERPTQAIELSLDYRWTP